MDNQQFMRSMFNSLRIPKERLLGEYLNLIQVNSEEEIHKIVDKFPEDLSKPISLPVLDLAFSQGNNHLWAQAYCLTQYHHIVDILQNEDPFIGTPAIKEKCDEDKDFLLRLLAHLFNTDLCDIESKNLDLTLYDFTFEGEVYTVKFTFLKKGTYDEIYYLDDLEQEVDIKIMTCLISED